MGLGLQCGRRCRRPRGKGALVYNIPLHYHSAVDYTSQQRSYAVQSYSVIRFENVLIAHILLANTCS